MCGKNESRLAQIWNLISRSTTRRHRQEWELELVRRHLAMALSHLFWPGIRGVMGGGYVGYGRPRPPLTQAVPSSSRRSREGSRFAHGGLRVRRRERTSICTMYNYICKEAGQASQTLHARTTTTTTNPGLSPDSR